ncbi:uncharacterized protein N7458_003989 [Penicillium daleae]|uniref:CWH43-like N-terminal domain-containing protein n=1 Tax=Penicillium daleae TaxID=63821 RepID=A0AAD6G4Z6_9EURO|nr:uncharacterized protein N7458_003989 [Penicillium daleae]KAJ5455725.1 hypothetical protein N7458_003989 [Penicillium daleae]
MLFAMIGHWIVAGQPKYDRMEPGQTIPFISDIGAQELKPLFVIGCIVTMLFLNLAFYQSIQSKGNSNYFCIYFSASSTFAGSLGLIMLSVFDNINHKFVHDAFVTIFMMGYLIGATVICIDYFYLTGSSKLQKQGQMFKTSFLIKLSFIITEIAFILAFRCTDKTQPRFLNGATNLCVVIAFTFTGYILSFVVDLLPSSWLHIIPSNYKQLETDMDLA